MPVADRWPLLMTHLLPDTDVRGAAPCHADKPTHLFCAASQLAARWRQGKRFVKRSDCGDMLRITTNVILCFARFFGRLSLLY